MPTPEGAFKKLVVGGLEACGAVVVPYVATQFAYGWPDTAVVSKQWVGWLEFKAQGKSPRLNQRLNMEKANARQLCMLVCEEPGYIRLPDGTLLFEFADAASLLEKLSCLDPSVGPTAA